ncbi:TPA: DedA family protein, partial [Morganella morganii]|nr:DedA family protein [Morganella morganii]
LANLSSAVIWAFGLLAPGAFGLKWMAGLMGG